MTVILGMNLSHDGSACIVRDGQLVSALALERTTRVKRGVVPHHEFAGEMANLVSTLLADQGLLVTDVDHWIATSTESRDQVDEQRLLRIVGLLAAPERQLALPHPGHHLAHAASAFYGSGFESAAVLVVDAYGSIVGQQRERETAFSWQYGESPVVLFTERRGSTRVAGVRRDDAISMPQEIEGVGEIYRVVTLALGFYENGTAYDDAGKTMGLAPFGKRISQSNLFIDPRGESLSFESAARSLVELGLARTSSDGLVLVPRRHNEPLTQFHKNLAAQVQSEFETACLQLAQRALQASGSRRLALSGGCFLNSVANARIVRELDLEDLFVFPAATDDGTAVGAAFYAYHHLVPPASRRHPSRLRSVNLGPRRVEAAADRKLVADAGLRYKAHPSLDDAARAAADRLAQGEIVAWFQDHSEFGPRALGARSILCHPGLRGMKDRLNARVKFRESFRPFAASVLSERADDLFDCPRFGSPHMLLVANVRESAKRSIQEVTHIDGTCRIQTVDASDGIFRSLIERFFELTGLPAVLNTSFNQRGAPIVETPSDALDCLMGSRLDVLFIGLLEIEPPHFEALVPSLTASASEPAMRTALSERDATAPTGSTLSGRVTTFMRLADGSRSVESIADELGIDRAGLVDACLELRRLGLVFWQEIDRRQILPLPAQYMAPGNSFSG